MGAMKALGKNYSNEEVQNMISNADKQGKGRVDFQDFLALLENVSKCATSAMLCDKQKIPRDWVGWIFNHPSLNSNLIFFFSFLAKSKGIT